MPHPQTEHLPGNAAVATLYEALTFNAPIETWFGVGGTADRYAVPDDEDQARDCVLAFAGHTVRVHGDGANLLVADEGVDGLVLSLERLNTVETIEEPPDDGPGPVVLRVGAGKALPKLITECVREGIAGLEHLAGIPASVGGAVVMNAGGTFGEIASAVRSVRALTKTGAVLDVPRDEITFSYRGSGLEHLIITSVELELERVPANERDSLRTRLKDVMAYKKGSQPLASKSAGCVFKNPKPGVSAGALIERAGCKGLRIGGAEVSDKHANFVVTHDGCTATNILELLDEIEARVRAKHNVQLEREIKVWSRSSRIV